MQLHDMHRGDAVPSGCYELRFDSLYRPGSGIAVPCDASGQVDLNVLSERLRAAYLGARALIGREYAYPVVRPLYSH